MAEISIRIVELFRSIQGESSFAGWPFVFVRLAGCDLDCAWCDTDYARDPESGEDILLENLIDKIRDLGGRRVLLTGGEPLLQSAAAELAFRLTQLGFTVCVETNGAHDISPLAWPIHRIMDIKCPSSGMHERFCRANLTRLRGGDEVKFVLADRTDYEYARDLIEAHDLPESCTVLLSPVADRLAPADLAQWLLFDDLNARLQLQLHRLIWPGQLRAV